MTEEQYCLQMLVELRESYARYAKPYLDRLIAIECMKSPCVTLIFHPDYSAPIHDPEGVSGPPPTKGDAMKTPSKFHLGQIVATPAVLEHFSQEDLIPLEYVTRHAQGDWGEICADDKQANDNDIVTGNRLLSAYTVAGKKIWIITEADRSSTTLLFPDEY